MSGFGQLRVGKLRTSSLKYPSEASFVSSINAQMQVVTNELNSIFDQIDGASASILLEAVQPTFRKAQEYCPKKTNDLVNSGYAEITDRGKYSRVEVGFARGGNPPYGVFVHEMTSYHHEPPTRSKFLQAAMMEDFGQLRNFVYGYYQQFMGF